MPSFSFFAGGSLILLWRLCLFLGFVAHLISGTKESPFHITDKLCGRLFQQAEPLCDRGQGRKKEEWMRVSYLLVNCC